MEKARPKKIVITTNMQGIASGIAYLSLEIKSECKEEDLKNGVQEVCSKLIECFRGIGINQKTYPSNILITKDIPRLISTDYYLGEEAIKLELDLKNISIYDERILNAISEACRQLLGCFGEV